MSGPSAEKDATERDLWWGYLCPALANIGALKEAQRDLIALGADWAEAGRILSRVQSFYVDAAHRAAQRYLAAECITPPPEYQWGVTQGDEPVRTLHEEGARRVAGNGIEGEPRRRLMRRTLGPWVEVAQDGPRVLPPAESEVGR